MMARFATHPVTNAWADRRVAPQRRRGVTRVEMLVVSASTLVFLALLIPGLSHSRETARANYCALNLGRLDRALTRHLDLTQQLPSNWVLALLPELETDSDINLAKPGLAIFTLPRPAAFTCPSHPNALESDPEKQLSLYVLVVTEPGKQGRYRPKWFFRDRERDVPQGERDRWIEAPVLTPEQADRQLLRPGPHAEGRYRQSNGFGEAMVVDPRR